MHFYLAFLVEIVELRQNKCAKRKQNPVLISFWRHLVIEYFSHKFRAFFVVTRAKIGLYNLPLTCYFFADCTEGEPPCRDIIRKHVDFHLNMIKVKIKISILKLNYVKIFRKYFIMLPTQSAIQMPT